MLNPTFRRPQAETATVRARLQAMLKTLDTRADEIAATWSAMSEEVFDELDRAQHVSEARLAAALDAATTEAPAPRGSPFGRSRRSACTARALRTPARGCPPRPRFPAIVSAVANRIRLGIRMDQNLQRSR